LDATTTARFYGHEPFVPAVCLEHAPRLVLGTISNSSHKLLRRGTCGAEIDQRSERKYRWYLHNFTAAELFLQRALATEPERGTGGDGHRALPPSR